MKNPRSSLKYSIFTTRRSASGVLVTCVFMIVYLALGSNLGDRQAHLASAVDGLSRRGIQAIRSASLYATEPHGLAGAPWFLNTVLEANTLLPPEQLLEACLAVEKENLR